MFWEVPVRCCGVMGSTLPFGLTGCGFKSRTWQFFLSDSIILQHVDITDVVLTWPDTTPFVYRCSPCIQLANSEKGERVPVYQYQPYFRYLTETWSELTLTHSGDRGPNRKLHMSYWPGDALIGGLHGYRPRANVNLTGPRLLALQLTLIGLHWWPIAAIKSKQLS